MPHVDSERAKRLFSELDSSARQDTPNRRAKLQETGTVFCMNCGQRLPNDANFGQRCGRPQTQVTTGFDDPRVETAPRAVPIETAEIEYHDRGISWKGSLLVDFGLGEQTRWRFVARAFGPTGEYIARSVDFEVWEDFLPMEQATGDKRRFTQQVLDRFTARLHADGWQSAPSGAFWYNGRFTREARV